MRKWMKLIPPFEVPVIKDGWRRRHISTVLAKARARWLADCARRLGLQPESHTLKVVEIGVHIGRHAWQLRKVFPNADLYLIDPWEYLPEMDGYMFNRAHSDDHSGWVKVYEDVVRMFGDDPKVHLLKMKNAEAAPQFREGSLDVVYVDGNHKAEYVAEDIRTWLPKLRIGGVMAGHDYKYSSRARFTVPHGVQITVGARNIVNGPDKNWLYYKDRER